MKRNRSYRSLLTTVIIAMLSGLYLLFSVGVLKSTHRCMGREASVVFFSAEADSCACALFAGEEDDCCDNEHNLLKIEDSQKSLQSFQMAAPALPLLGQIYDAALATVDVAAPGQHFRQEEDILLPERLYKVYCSLVFYDDESIG